MNSVWYNDWRQVEVTPLDAFSPTRPVSVVIPYYQTTADPYYQKSAATLARTLATLEGQTYPREMFEVILVDDGSEPPLERPPSTPLDVKVIRRERRVLGRTLMRATHSQAMNAGARAAAHDILLFLNSVMLVEANWMAAHARWHHAVSDALTVGIRAYVDVNGLDATTIRQRPGSLNELLAGRPMDPPLYEGYMAKTNDLTSRADDPFQVVVGGNLGMSKGFYWSVGGADESFTYWGLEDVELGYRAYTCGGLLVPVRDSLSYRQGRWDEDRDAKHRSTKIQEGIAAHRIAHPWYRGNRPGRIFAVPQYVVTVDGGRCPASQIVRAVGNVLTDRVRDLLVRIEMQASDDDEERLARLQAEFGPDPRVRVAPTPTALDEFPASPFHVSLPAAVVAKDLVHRLRAKLGDAVHAESVLPDGSGRVSITRSWALHRARRTGKRAADFGEARTIPAAALKLAVADPAEDVDRVGRAEAVNHSAQWRRLRDRLGAITHPGEVGPFLKWLAGSVWRRVGGRPR